MEKREIKFRALKDDMSDCKFVYGSLVVTPDGTPRITTDVGGFFHTCIKGTEGQYTGLVDKNSRPRYEGDIIRRNTGYIFLEEKKVFMLGTVWGAAAWGYDFHPDDEIIGNINENPELLLL